MRSTHNTTWAIAKSCGVILAMVGGTAILMASCSETDFGEKVVLHHSADLATAHVFRKAA